MAERKGISPDTERKREREEREREREREREGERESGRCAYNINAVVKFLVNSKQLTARIFHYAQIL